MNQQFSRRIGYSALAIFLLASAFPAAALAGGNPGVKLTRGLLNIGTGWLEIPAQMAEQEETDNSAGGWVFHGFLKGVAMGLARTLYGVWDILSFPVAPYDAPIMDPDTLIRPKHAPTDIQPLPPEKSQSPL